MKQWNSLSLLLINITLEVLATAKKQKGYKQERSQSTLIYRRHCLVLKRPNNSTRILLVMSDTF